MKRIGLFLVVAALGLPALLPAAEFVIKDEDLNFTEALSGFWQFPPGPESPADWSSPYDYYNGTIYARYEVKSKPTNTTNQFQLCIWQDNTDLENCSSDKALINGPGVYTKTTSPRSWWKKNGVPVDFSRPEDFWNIGVNMRDASSCLITDYVTPNCWSKRNLFCPMQVRITLVAVSAGATFSGWSYYTGSRVGYPRCFPSPGTHDEPILVTLMSETDGAQLRYTLDGSEPTSSSVLYTAPVLISSSKTLRVRGFKSGLGASTIATYVYQINTDTIPPTLKAVSAQGDSRKIQVIFSEAVNAGSAANYTLDQGLSVSAAAVSAWKNIVELTVSSALSEGKDYTLTVSGIKDLKGNTLAGSVGKVFKYSAGDMTGYWDFDEGSGTTAADRSAYSRTGTINSAPVWEDGKYGKCLKFDGRDDQVVVSDAPQYNPTRGAWSVCAWINTANPILQSYMSIVSKKESWEGRGGFALSYNPGFRLLMFSGSQGNAAKAEDVFLYGDWHHIAAVSNGVLGRIYVDGKDVTTDGVMGIIEPCSTDVYIGTSPDGKGAFFGKMDEIRMYNKALTAAEITAIMNTSAISPQVYDKAVLAQRQLQVTPNPAVSGAGISFFLDRPEQTSLGIYTPGGEKVTLLSEGYLPAGKQAFYWQIDPGTRSGVYICRLQTGPETYYKKIFIK